MRWQYVTAILAALCTMTAVSHASEPIFKATGVYAEKPLPRVEACYPVVPKKEWNPAPAEKPVVKAAPAQVSYAAYSPWYVNGHNTPDSHLIGTHGVSPATLQGLSQDQKNRLHGKMHGEQPRYASRPVQHSQVVMTCQPRATSGCPNGRCPTAGAGIFTRKVR